MASKASKLPTIVAHPDWSQAQLNYFKRLEAALPIIIGYLGDDIPDLSNHSDAQLVDETGVLKKVKKGADKAEKAHVERLKIRIGDRKSLVGENYTAKYKGSTRTILNQEKCKELIQRAEENQLNLVKLVQMVIDQEIGVPNDVWLRDAEDTEDGIAESNIPHFYTTSPGNALYVEVTE